MRSNEEDEGAEPDELGIRMVEHGECVSSNDFPHLTTVSIL